MLRMLALTRLLLSAPPREPEVGSGPEPAPTPVAWEFAFRYLHPRLIEVRLAPDARPEAYWYLVYTAVNTSSTTQQFYPSFELVTEDLRVISTDTGISPLVFEAIRERHKLTHPYLVHPTKALGELRVGEDYARESVAIWRARDVQTNRFTIYIGGLSGEARILPNPAYDPDRPETRTVLGPDGREREVIVNPKYFTIRKTLELRYTLPAPAGGVRVVEPRFEGARWIMR